MVGDNDGVLSRAERAAAQADDAARRLRSDELRVLPIPSSVDQDDEPRRCELEYQAAALVRAAVDEGQLHSLDAVAYEVRDGAAAIRRLDETGEADAFECTPGGVVNTNTRRVHDWLEIDNARRAGPDPSPS